MRNTMAVVLGAVITSMIALSPVFSQESPDESDAKIEVKMSTFCKQVVDREPVDVGKEFPADIGRVYLWTNIKADNPPVMIKHVWYYNDEKIFEVPLTINYERTRTWSYKTIYPDMEGSWYVDIVDKHDTFIDTCAFTIIENTP